MKTILFFGITIIAVLYAISVYTSNHQFTRTVTVKNKHTMYIDDGFGDYDMEYLIDDINNKEYRVGYLVWINLEINKAYTVKGYDYLGLYDYIHSANEVVTEQLDSKSHMSI